MREDAIVERTLLARGPRLGDSSASGAAGDEVLVVGSGGCTAFDLVATDETLSVTAFDRSQAQLDLIEAKRAALSQTTPLSPTSPLLHGGVFEGLFRVLRAGFSNFIVDSAPGGRGFGAYFDESALATRLDVARSWIENPYFSAVFVSTFHDELLWAMFGPAATQHAERGSYPAYFARAFARGLSAETGPRNRFLQHVFLGTYRAGSLPPYLERQHTHGSLETPLRRLQLVHGSLPDVPSLERFRLVSLSNIFDWSDDALVREWAELLATKLRPGAMVVVRKLNNHRDIGRVFSGTKRFRADESLADAVTLLDESLFYERFEVFVRDDTA